MSGLEKGRGQTDIAQKISCLSMSERLERLCYELVRNGK